MKSFLQHIGETELNFYLEKVPDHAEYKELMKKRLLGVIVDLSEINQKFDRQFNLIEELKKSGISTTVFSDKTTFKMFNSIDWNITEYHKLRLKFNITDIHKLVEAWSETEINKIKGK